jgi:methionyl-tRNA formyltransferase
MAERKSPVHQFAERRGLAVLTPRRLKDAAEQRAFASHNADVAVVVAYGLILPGPVLDAPRHGCLNLHASALPRWRGAAPIQRAIMAGDAETAACVMRMDEGLDTGPVCAIDRIAIGPDATAGELHDLLAARGAKLMQGALFDLGQDALGCMAQPDLGVTYATKIDKGETRIDFARPAREVHNRVRGLSPAPGAWLEAVHDGRVERIKVLRTTLVEGVGAPGTVLDDQLAVACGDGAVRILQLQRPGKRPMAAAEFLRGFALQPGVRLGGVD